MAERFTCDRRVCDELMLQWVGFTAAPNLKVAVIVRLDEAAPTNRCRITIDGAEVRTAAFPQCAAIALQANDLLAVPQWIGEPATQARAVVNQTARAVALYVITSMQ